MRIVLAAVLFLSLGTAEDPAELGTPGVNANTERGLELRTRVIKAEYCDSSRLKLYLELNYRNTGTTTILLPKLAGMPISYRVSKNVDKLRAGIFELNPRIYRFDVLGKEEDLLTDEPGPGFVALAPGEEFSPILEFEQTFIGPFVALNLDCSDGDDPCLRKGKHVLQVRILVFGAREYIVRQLRERWRSRGDLYSGAILTEPMEFEVEPRRARKTVRCN